MAFNLISKPLKAITLVQVSLMALFINKKQPFRAAFYLPKSQFLLAGSESIKPGHMGEALQYWPRLLLAT